MIYGAGMLDCGMSLNYSQLVIDNEFIKMLRNVSRGIPVNDYNLAVDTINKVGPRGHFLMEEHTLANMSLQSDSKIFNRGRREDWEAEGSPSVNTKANEIADEILANHKPMPLTEGATEKMDDIIEEAKKRFCKKA